MAYILNLTLFLVYSLILKSFSRNNGEAQKKIAIMACVQIVLFRVLANPYNYTDTILYADAFERVITWKVSDIFTLHMYSEWGYGYLLLCWLVGQFTKDTQYIFMVCSIVSILPVIWFYYKSSDNIILTILFYLVYPMLFYQSCGVLRQHISVAYMLLALYYINKPKAYIPFLTISILFHTTSIIFLPYIVFRKLLDRRVHMGKSILLIFVMMIFIRYGMNWFGEVSERYTVSSSASESNMLPVLMFSSFAVMTIVNRLYKYKINSADLNYINFILYGLAVSISSIGIHLAGRLTIPFLYVFPVAISIMTKYSKENKGLNFSYNWLIIALAFFMTYLAAQKSVAYHYSFFWERSFM